MAPRRPQAACPDADTHPPPGGSEIGRWMTKSQKKIVQYLDEAHATEQALTRVLQSQIAMTPRGSYRSALETHLGETRSHADRVARRMKELGHGNSPLHVATDVVQTVVGQLL